MTSRLTAALPSGSILQRVICTATPRRRTMSISALSALTANSVQSSSSQPNVRQAFNQLVSSLDSGNLSDAQQAYSALSELQSSSQSSNRSSAAKWRSEWRASGVAATGSGRSSSSRPTCRWSQSFYSVAKRFDATPPGRFLVSIG